MRNRATLIVAILALVASVCAIYFDNAHFDSALEQDQIRAKEADEQFEEAMELASRALEEDTQHYQTLSEQFEGVIAPHVRHEEVYDHVSLLYDRLVLYRSWVNTLPSVYSNVVYPYYEEASRNFSKAEEELRDGNFEQAMQPIATAYVSLAEGIEAYEEAKAAVE